MKGYKVYELSPVDGRASFYGKAKVLIDSNGNEFLQSYETIVCMRANNGLMLRCWYGLNGGPGGKHSMTTTRHIKAFSGLDRKQYGKLQYCDIKSL